MAAAPSPDEVLRSTPGKENFQRVARLLISGGTTLLREVFDNLCPPLVLPKILQSPATKNQLKKANLTKPQRDCLNPSPGVYGKSIDFDITLLFRLLKNICNLTPPTMGWDSLPVREDYSLAADLARIKYYRNAVYGHVGQDMEITNDEFPLLWEEISDTLISIAEKISIEKKREWQEAIGNLLKDPLTVKDERNVEELFMWYKNDTVVKKSLEELKSSTKELREVLDKSSSALQTTVQGEAQGIKDQLDEKLTSSSKQIQKEIARLETIFQENLGMRTHEIQTAVREQFEEVCQSLDRLSSSVDGAETAEDVASNNEEEMAIPLCLPNNYQWDPEQRKCIKTEDQPSSLYVVKKALAKLRKIKGPVCVVCVAGPYRTGKSYILSEAFDQPVVFPLGHEMLPETVGIWMWILPDEYEDSKGQRFSVVLLDSEGIDSAVQEGCDEHQIFTLTVLLASVLIYNSQGVPKRRDLEGLDFIANISKRINMRSRTGANAGLGDEEIFKNIFPFFIWLLRDVTLALPRDCKDIKDYFLTKVFKEQNSKTSSDHSQEVIRSILRFFPGFDAFALPPPAADTSVLIAISDNKSQLQPHFLSGFEKFKQLLKKTLAPKNSFNIEEFVSGEGLAELVELYTKAINTPDAIPNVQNAWELFVNTKCSDAKRTAVKSYSTIMTSELSGKLPCHSDEIRKSHLAAFAECETELMVETAGLSTNTVEDCLNQLKTSIDDILNKWQMENANSTREFCTDLIIQLKKQRLNPVLQRLNEREAATLSFQDITNAYDKLKEDYEKFAIGAKDVIAEVFFELHQKLKEEIEQNLTTLKMLKDYNERLAREKEARAFQEQETARIQEKLSRLMHENENSKKEMEHLILKQNEEIARIRTQMANRDTEHQQQIKNLEEANEKTLRDQREENYVKNQTLHREILNLKEENKRNFEKVKGLRQEISEARSNSQESDNRKKEMEHLILKQSEESARIRSQMENKDTEYQQQITNMKETNRKAMSDLREEYNNENQKLNREVLNLKEDKTKKMEEIRELRQEIREARSDRHGSFIRREQVAIQSTTSPYMKGASLESRNAPYMGEGSFGSTTTSYMEEGSFEYTTTPYMEEGSFGSTTSSDTEEGSFESTNAPYMEDASFEYTTTPYMEEGSFGSTTSSDTEESSFESTDAPYMEEISFASAYTPDMDQDERNRRRTDNVLNDGEKIESTRKTLAAVQDTKFRDAVLNRNPPLAPIASPVAAVIGAGAQMIKNCSIV